MISPQKKDYISTFEFKFKIDSRTKSGKDVQVRIEKDSLHVSVKYSESGKTKNPLKSFLILNPLIFDY